MRLRGLIGAAAVAALVLIPASAAQADQIRSAEYWLDDYGIRRAWAVTQGSGVTIAVIDTGVDSSVAELRGVVTGGTDVSGHGAKNGQTPVGDEGSGQAVQHAIDAAVDAGPTKKNETHTGGSRKETPASLEQDSISCNRILLGCF